MIAPGTHNELDLAMDVSTLRPGSRQAAVALSASGEMYRGAGFNSQTHLLNVEAGQSALYNATQNLDYEVEQLVIMTEGEYFGVNPVLAQVMIDFAYRTNQDLSVSIVNTRGQNLLAKLSVFQLAPYYRRAAANQLTLQMSDRDQHLEPPQAVSTDPDVHKFRHYALKGANRAFLTSDTGQRYGAAVRDQNGMIYFGGQYGSFEHRTNIHAEMGATMLALLDGASGITDLALVSTRFPDSPATMCGCCRQFVHEATPDNNPLVHMFAFEQPAAVSIKTISELLPDGWSSTHESRS